MNLILETRNLNRYLQCDDIIDYNSDSIKLLAEQFLAKQKNETLLVKAMYEYVRDKINHSFDIQSDTVTCTASEVLANGHGICYAKAHLLAALLRYAKIPTGLCYQTLILDDKANPTLVLHGLNAVYLRSLDQWIRLDARGNKPGVNAQFCLTEERLAFSVREALGEISHPNIHISPSPNVITALKTSKTLAELLSNLPQRV